MNVSREAFWRKKGYKVFAVVVIRFVETILLSIIPSLFSVLLILLSADPNRKVLEIFQWISFAVLVAGNCFFCFRFSVQRKKRKEYYLINIGTYLIYAVVARFLFSFNDALFCSMVFTPLRALETFKISTKKSMLLCHCIIIGLTAVIELIANAYNKHIKKLERESRIDETVEFDKDTDEDVLITQKNKVIQLFSDEELSEQIKNDEKEEKKALRMAVEDLPAGVLDEEFSKGQGEEIEFVSPKYFVEMPDEKEAASLEMMISENSMYSGDALWNSEIYKGRTEDNKPVVDYVDDHLPELPQESHFEDVEDTEYFPILSDNELLEVHLEDINSAKTAENIPYTTDQLWENEIYQGGKLVERKTGEYIEDEATPEWVNNFAKSEMNDFDSEKLWGDVTQGEKKVEISEDSDELEDVDVSEEKRVKSAKNKWLDKVIETDANPYEDYDADSLWDDMVQGDGTAEDESDYIEDYAPENLWDNVFQGNGETVSNPYEDYDADSLWSADIHQGRKNKITGE